MKWNSECSSLVSRLSHSGTGDVYMGRAWYLFSCNHDVIKIGPKFLEQKGNIYSLNCHGIPWQPYLYVYWWHHKLAVLNICLLCASWCSVRMSFVSCCSIPLGGGTMSLAEVENMHGCPAAVHSRGVWGHAPPGNLGVLRRFLRHTEKCGIK